MSSPPSPEPAARAERTVIIVIVGGLLLAAAGGMFAWYSLGPGRAPAGPSGETPAVVGRGLGEAVDRLRTAGFDASVRTEGGVTVPMDLPVRVRSAERDGASMILDVWASHSVALGAGLDVDGDGEPDLTLAGDDRALSPANGARAWVIAHGQGGLAASAPTAARMQALVRTADGATLMAGVDDDGVASAWMPEAGAGTIVLGRLAPDGAFDAAFGNGGFVRVPAGRALVRFERDGTLVGVWIDPRARGSLRAIRLGPDGRRDASFAGEPIPVAADGAVDILRVRSVEIDSKRRVLVQVSVAAPATEKPRSCVVRIAANGTREAAEILPFVAKTTRVAATAGDAVMIAHDVGDPKTGNVRLSSFAFGGEPKALIDGLVWPRRAFSPAQLMPIRADEWLVAGWPGLWVPRPGVARRPLVLRRFRAGVGRVDAFPGAVAPNWHRTIGVAAAADGRRHDLLGGKPEPLVVRVRDDRVDAEYGARATTTLRRLDLRELRCLTALDGGRTLVGANHGGRMHVVQLLASGDVDAQFARAPSLAEIRDGMRDDAFGTAPVSVRALTPSSLVHVLTRDGHRAVVRVVRSGVRGGVDLRVLAWVR